MKLSITWPLGHKWCSSGKFYPGIERFMCPSLLLVLFFNLSNHLTIFTYLFAPQSSFLILVKKYIVAIVHVCTVHGRASEWQKKKKNSIQLTSTIPHFFNIPFCLSFFHAWDAFLFLFYQFHNLFKSKSDLLHLTLFFH